jgi:AcrR family transcriptional regulator
MKTQAIKKQTDTHQRILEAGLEEFSRKGYVGATMREIARQADVAELTVFRHFGSKQRLFQEVHESFTFLPMLRAMLPRLGKLEYRQALTEIARTFLARLSERKDLVRVMHAEMHLYPPAIRDIHHRTIEEMIFTLAEYFRKLQRRGAVRRFDPVTGARAFLGMMFGYFNTIKFLPDSATVDHEAVIGEFVEIFTVGTLSGPLANRKEH